jgi:hypothetical protein
MTNPTSPGDLATSGEPTWTPTPNSTLANLNAIWGSAPDDIWAVGDYGAIVHWDGQAWSAVPSGTTYILSGVWGSGRDDVWAVGSFGTVLHWDGTAWTKGGTFPFDRDFLTVRGTSGKDVWALADGYADIWGDGLAWRWDGNGWSKMSVEATVPRGLWAGASNDVWVGGDAVLHWNGMGWSKTDFADGNVFAIWGAASDDLWAVVNWREGDWDRCAIFHGQGNQWSSAPSDGRWGDTWLMGIWGSGRDDVWAVGNGATVVHWDGNRWTRVAVPVSSYDFEAVWGSGPRDVWVVGGGGTILHYNG